MYVERETAANASDVDTISGTHYENAGSVYDSKDIAENESRALRIVKERIIAELRTVKSETRSSALSIGESCPSATNGDKSLPIPLQGKGSSRCKSTVSQDSGYYSEPRMHTPKSSTDRCIVSRKERSKPPLSGAVMRFVPASHPDDFKDTKTMKKIRSHANRTYLHGADQKATATGDVITEECLAPENHYALPDIGNLISGWEANLHVGSKENIEPLPTKDLADTLMLAKLPSRRPRKRKPPLIIADWREALEAKAIELQKQGHPDASSPTDSQRLLATSENDIIRRGIPEPIDPIDKHNIQQGSQGSGDVVTDTADGTTERIQISKHLENVKEDHALLMATSDKLEETVTAYNVAEQLPSILRFSMPGVESFLPPSLRTHQQEQICQVNAGSPLHDDPMCSVEDATALGHSIHKRLDKASAQPQSHRAIQSITNKDVDPSSQVIQHNPHQEQIQKRATAEGKKSKEDQDHEPNEEDEEEATDISLAALIGVDNKTDVEGAPSALSDDLSESGDLSDNDTNDKIALALSTMKSLLLQNLLDHTLLEATEATGDSSSSSRSSSARNGTIMSTLQSSQSLVNTNTTKRSRGGGRDDPGDDDDDSSSEDDDDDRRPQKKHAFDRMSHRRLLCPFYQREPDKHTKAACRGEGFTEMGKLKDHLKRVHTQPLRCPRCHIEVGSVEERDEHLSQDIICAKKSKPHDERIQPQVLKRLDFKKVPFANARNTEEKWRMMYRVLFSVKSEAEIPSPYDRNVLSPGLADALSEALEEELAMELAPLLSPIMARIKNRIPAIIQNCRAKLAYHASLANDEVASNTSIAQSSAGSSISSEPARLRKKKKLSALSQCVDHTFGAIPRLTATLIEAGEAQTPCLSVHHTTPSGSSTGSGQKSLTPPSSSTEQVFCVESMDVPQYSAIDNWNVYKSTLFSCPYGSDSMLSNLGIPTLPDGFSSQDSAIRPFYNDPHIYGGSSSLDPNLLENTSILQSELNVQGCYQGRGYGSGNVDSTSGFPPYPI